MTQGTPTMIATFQNCVSRPMVTSTANSSPSPRICSQGDSGACTASWARFSAGYFRRNIRCVNRMIIQVRIAPNSATPNRMFHAFGLAYAVMDAASTPNVDTAAACHGVPRLLTEPSTAGASFERASENSMRVHRYRFVFMLENAALMITKFITVAALASPKTENTLTNGLSVAIVAAEWLHRE